MKTLRLIGMALCVTHICVFYSCGYDDDKLWDSLKQLEERIATLETICKKNNENITSLQTILNSLETRDYITDIVPITNDGEEIGYKITFAQQGTITIYNGTDGKDGNTPIITIKENVDGNYYWTINGEFIEVNGEKIKAQGKDGATPELKIENGYWYISYNGNDWTRLGKATGENSTNDKDCIFSSVTEDEENVYFNLANGTVISISKNKNDESTEDSTADLSKVIIGTWVQDGDDDIMVIKSDKTVTWYENETDYMNNEVSDIMEWEVKGEWLKIYVNGRLHTEARPKEVNNNVIIWKDYDEYENDYSDSYGNYRLWTWERYSK